METKMPKYVTVAGVRTPGDWTIEELRSALEKRDIRFGNEEEIIAVYGVFLKTKDELTEQIEQLQRHMSSVKVQAEEADNVLRTTNARLTCPKCQNVYSILEETKELSKAKGKKKK